MATPEPTAVAKRPEEADERLMGQLPAEMRAALAARKLANLYVSQLQRLSWGSVLDQQTARALAEWGRQNGVDVMTEVDLLGNRFYVNARYYMRRLAEKIAAGLVEYAYPDHIHADDRLSGIGPEGEAEALRRLKLRIKYGVKNAAAGAVVFRIKLRSMEQEVVGVNSCGGGIKKNDPVGEAEPIKTAETRAIRRVMRLLAEQKNEAASGIEISEAAEVQLGALEPMVKHSKAQLAPGKQSHEVPTAGGGSMRVSAGGDVPGTRSPTAEEYAGGRWNEPARQAERAAAVGQAPAEKRYLCAECGHNIAEQAFEEGAAIEREEMEEGKIRRRLYHVSCLQEREAAGTAGELPPPQAPAVGADPELFDEGAR